MNFPNTSGLTVLQLISSEGYFGVENMLVNLSLSLRSLGCQVIVGVFSDSRCPHVEVGERARELGLAVEIIPCTGRFDLGAVTRIKQLISVHGIDVLHSHGYKADLYARAARPRRKALIATCHNWPSSLLSMRIYAAIDRFFLRGFDRVAVISDAVAAMLRNAGVQSAKIQTIPNGVGVQKFREAQPVLREELGLGNAPVVGFVGRLVPGKGGDILLRAAQQVLKVLPQAKFVLVGDGPSRQQWEQLAAELKIDGCIFFAGVRKDMPSAYASLDLLVLPSLCEAMPMCLLEGMAAGKPVIATRVGSVPKIVDDNVSGFLTEPGDVDGLASAIITILKDPARAHDMGETGRARIMQQFSAESMGAQYLELYRDVIERRKPAFRNVLLYSE